MAEETNEHKHSQQFLNERGGYYSKNMPRPNFEGFNKLTDAELAAKNYTRFKGLLATKGDVQYPFARTDMVSDLYKFRQHIQTKYPGGDFFITSGSRIRNTGSGHDFGLGIDIVPNNKITWDQLYDEMVNDPYFRSVFNPVAHNNMPPGPVIIKDPFLLDKMSASRSQYHLDVKYKNQVFDPNKKISPSDTSKNTLLKGGVEYSDYRGGGGGLSTGGASSLNGDQYYDQLKHDTSVTGMHHDPSHMTEDQYFEMLRLMFKAGEAINYLPHTENVTGTIIKPHYQDTTTGNTTSIKSKNFYNPTVQDYIENFPNVNGAIASYEQYIWGKKDDNLYNPTPAASQPFNRVTPYSTPNSQAISKVLYGSVELGAQYAKGYLQDRARDLVFGKKASKELKKIGNYYSLPSQLKTFAKNLWQPISKTALGTAMSNAWAPIGSALSSAAGWVTAQAGIAWGAITSLPVIGAAIAAVGSAVATAVGWALTALAFFAW